ncbi:hypothetical protein [Treponema sp. Marseille-Q3903]|uniref:hypothetical protein n=1 Tax=Treponema sp. Marseille-Q3903 TaxID=2766703 RepID=UPI001651E6F7|nr:hypothetical protein [Treponema sp. Marseille-Q3903]MBC6712993.1 hypothetical protein [Treponema sp. Marseille-Q3903]
MKQKKIASLIGALILIISAVVLITGCSQPNSNTDIIIEFDVASVKCQNRSSYPYTDVTSGSPIQEKDVLYFKAILPTGKVVENWYINDVKQEYQTGIEMFYTVKAADIVGNKLKVSVITKDAVQRTVEFDSASVKCKNTKSYTKVTTGSPIQEKDELLFEAILPTGKVVENWYINDVKQEYETDVKMFYKVKASDIVGGKLKVSVITKDAVQGTIEFDSARVKCKNTNSYTKVTTGSPIQEKDELLFEAVLPTGKVVENWYINDVKQEYETDVKMFYKVKASDIVGGKLKISVITKDAVQGTIEFDSASVKCKNTNSYTKVTTGSPIQEKDELLFEAVLPTGKVVENWYINDVKQEYETDVKMFYKVKASDIVSGKLKINVVFK